VGHPSPIALPRPFGERMRRGFVLKQVDVTENERIDSLGEAFPLP